MSARLTFVARTTSTCVARPRRWATSAAINTDNEDSLTKPGIDGWHNGRCYIAIDVRLRKGILVVSVDVRP